MKLSFAHSRFPFLPLFFFFFTIFTLQFLTVTSATCHVDDETGLLGFKSSITADPSGILSSWKPGTDCCKWAGINCLANNRVTSLSLSGQANKPNSFLSGPISPSLSKLKFLDGLYLQNLRDISGPFPNFLFGLPDLKYIYIENNKLSGQIPRSIGNLTQLYAFSLYGNRFSGPIPSSISELTGLAQLKLGGNLLTGPIPYGIQRLKNLTLLSLDQNRLSGSIPDIFGSFSELRILRLSHNKFTGKIPASISSLAPKLLYLELGHNGLNGKIPEFLSNFKALDTLDLSWNSFSGVVPKSFANLTKIFNLDLSRNYLVDPFPNLSVKGIESLDLSYNKFHLSEIPKWVTSSPIIYSLKLAKCGIKLRLEDWKPVQTYFYDYIDLSENEISGSAIGLLNRTDYLVGFWASGNKLKFNLESLRIVQTLKNLDLSRNEVFGKVPNGVSGLEKLNVSHNHLCGKLPVAKFPASAFLGNDCLCGSPLAPCKSVA
ncbi:DNA damage-repair/toleration protein DRT100-like [Fagus crenata]